MAVLSAVSATASGDNLTSHVLSATSFGTGLSEVTVWVLQINHLPPSDSAALGIGAISIVIASVLMRVGAALMQKIGA